MTPPEKKPNMTTYTMMSAILSTRAGAVRQKAAETKVMVVTTLNPPILSAATLRKIRPKTLMALKIGNRYGIKSGEKPASLAGRVTYLNGTTIPNWKRKTPVIVLNKRISSKCLTYSLGTKRRRRGGSLDLTVKHAIPSSKMNIEANNHTWDML